MKVTCDRLAHTHTHIGKVLSSCSIPEVCNFMAEMLLVSQILLPLLLSCLDLGEEYVEMTIMYLIVSVVVSSQ